MVRLIIKPQYQEMLSRHALLTFSDFMKTSLGESVFDETKRNMRYIEIDGDHYYLKRMYHEKFRRSLYALLKGRLPHGAGLREWLAVTELQKAGMDVMEVVATGESLQLGFPGANFIMTRAVEGKGLDAVYPSLNQAQRNHYVQKMGALYGRQHARGFFAKVRIQDVICESANPGQADSSEKLVMIDREIRHPYPRRFTPGKSIESLTSAWRNHSKYGHSLSGAEFRLFIDAYLNAVKPVWAVKASQLLRMCREEWRSPKSGLAKHWYKFRP